MSKQRELIGTDVLDQACELLKRKVPIATIVRMLAIERDMHYRTAYNIIKADIAGHTAATRPKWLQPSPTVQRAPDGWSLSGGLTEQGQWSFINE